MTESAAEALRAFQLPARPNIDVHDAVALRAFLKEIPRGQTKLLRINHVEVSAESDDNVEDLVRKYHKAQKQSS